MNLADTPRLGAEDAARADHYALIARLFGSPPDAELLAVLAGAGQSVAADQGDLASAWTELAGVAAATTPEAAGEEYLRLFIGTGRPEIFLYGSYYQAGFLMEEPLADLRDDLATLGLSRRQGVGESEDHIAALAEVMRHLIQTGAALETQQALFARHLQPWVARLAEQLERAPAVFYRSVGRLLRSYFSIETEAFAMA